MSLHTLPRLSETATAGWKAGLDAARLQPTPAERSHARHLLRRAVAAGTVSPRDLAAAVQQGDEGIAHLMQRHAPALPLPAMGAQGVIGSAPYSVPPVSLLPGLKGLLRELAASGDFTEADARAVAQDTTCLTLAQRLTAAWNRRMARLVAPIRALVPEAPVPSSFLVIPTVLRHLLSGYHEAEDEGEVGVGMLVETDGDMAVAQPTVCVDPDARAVLVAAWAALATAMRVPLLSDMEDSVSILFGYADELLGDLALSVRWEGDTPQVTPAEWAVVADEIGMDAEDPDDVASMADYLRFCRRRNHAATVSLDDPSVMAWREAHAGTPAGRVIDTLLALREIALRAPTVPAEVTREEFSEEGYTCLFLLPIDSGVGWRLEDNVNQLWQECGSAHREDFLTKGAEHHLSAMMDRWVIDAALATAAGALMMHATHGFVGKPNTTKN